MNAATELKLNTNLKLLNDIHKNRSYLSNFLSTYKARSVF